MQIQVPRSAVGIVIGKNGDMIKKIQSETGAKVQFKPGLQKLRGEHVDIMQKEKSNLRLLFCYDSETGMAE